MLKYPLLDMLCPLFEWCPVNGGIVILEDASHYGGTIGGTYQVNDFALAKYPITNAQFQIFLDHPNGFYNQRWWAYSPQAIQWHLDHKNPKPTAFPSNNLPRTRVSWFDSMAFCHWLSYKLTDHLKSTATPSVDPHDISTWSIRLPTEQEWQRAALGETGWNYPWGNELDERRANYGNNIGQPTAVGQYPTGNSVFDISDMTGNIWEWCLTGWNNEKVNLEGYTYRIIKGGAWNITNQDHLRANDRGCHPPRGVLNDCGFRIMFSYGL